MGLFGWHQRRVLPALISLAGRNWIIGGEIVLLLAIVYGAFGSFGVPELFWDDSLDHGGGCRLQRGDLCRAGVVRHLPRRLLKAPAEAAAATGLEQG